MGNTINVRVRVVNVEEFDNFPGGPYVYGEDVINILTTLGMQRGIDLSTTINNLKELMGEVS